MVWNLPLYVELVFNGQTDYCRAEVVTDLHAGMMSSALRHQAPWQSVFEDTRVICIFIGWSEKNMSYLGQGTR